MTQGERGYGSHDESVLSKVVGSDIHLLVGFVFTYPINWWLVTIGWKHGMT